MLFEHGVTEVAIDYVAAVVDLVNQFELSGDVQADKTGSVKCFAREAQKNGEFDVCKGEDVWDRVLRQSDPALNHELFSIN